MKTNYLFLPLIIFSLTIAAAQNHSCNFTEWQMSTLLRHPFDSAITILGAPRLSPCPMGEAVSFNGEDDGILCSSNPLSGLRQFTIELIFRPDSGGAFEQRFFHAGSVKDDRVLFELRSAHHSWYLDGFIKSGAARLTLADSTKLHPHNQWYHAAFVVDNGNLKTYINSITELSGRIDSSIVTGGSTSIGVRQNQINWYKGAIYKIRLTPAALTPTEFMEYRP